MGNMGKSKLKIWGKYGNFRPKYGEIWEISGINVS